MSNSGWGNTVGNGEGCIGLGCFTIIIIWFILGGGWSALWGALTDDGHDAQWEAEYGTAPVDEHSILWEDIDDDDAVPNTSGPGAIDCNAFGSQRAAQRFFEDNGGPMFDPYFLDGDNDGIACEWR